MTVVRASLGLSTLLCSMSLMSFEDQRLQRVNVESRDYIKHTPCVASNRGPGAVRPRVTSDMQEIIGLRSSDSGRLFARQTVAATVRSQRVVPCAARLLSGPMLNSVVTIPGSAPSIFGGSPKATWVPRAFREKLTLAASDAALLRGMEPESQPYNPQCQSQSTFP
ncbi:MAG: hypothetical protein JWN34_509 [Bryobacterales bacterium]|nr:hypothetical protein [Bryobacterales bacterium]